MTEASLPPVRSSPPEPYPPPRSDLVLARVVHVRHGVRPGRVKVVCGQLPHWVARVKLVPVIQVEHALVTPRLEKLGGASGQLGVVMAECQAQPVTTRRIDGHRVDADTVNWLPRLHRGAGQVPHEMLSPVRPGHSLAAHTQTLHGSGRCVKPRRKLRLEHPHRHDLALVQPHHPFPAGLSQLRVSERLER